MKKNTQNDEQTFSLSKKDIMSITDVELAFSTTKFLPKIEQIPDEFFRGNDYTNIVEALFYGCDLPDGTMEFKFDVEPEAVNRIIVSHLKSFTPKHEHKIAGTGYLLSLIVEFKKHGEI